MHSNHFASSAGLFLTGNALPEAITTQADILLTRLLSSPMAPLVLPMLQGLGGPMGELIPNVNLADIGIGVPALPAPVTPPTAAGAAPSVKPAAAAAAATAAPAAGMAAAAAPTPPTPAPPPAATVIAATPASTADSSARTKLRALGAAARPLLSAQGSPAAVSNLLKAASAGEAGCALTEAEEAAVRAALPGLLARAAAVEASPPLPAASLEQSPPLSAEERTAVLAVGRALREWPVHRLSTAAFLARALLLLPQAQALLLEARCMHALASRALPAPSSSSPCPSASVQMMAMACVSNCLALPAPVALALSDGALLDNLVDSAVRMLKNDASSDSARLLASAALYNLTLHAPALADEERRTLLLCALADELGLARTTGELALRLLRALGQLLVHGSADTLELALALGLGEHTAELATADAPLAADLRALLRGEAEVGSAPL